MPGRLPPETTGIRAYLRSVRPGGRLADQAARSSAGEASPAAPAVAGVCPDERDDVEKASKGFAGGAAKPALRSGAAPASQLCCFNAFASTGIFLSRLPVAAKIALATAGTTADVPGSPMPPGASELGTIWTSIAGASLMRSIW